MTPLVSFSEVGVVSMLVLAPLALVLIVVLVRGYDIDLHMSRRPRPRFGRSRDDDPPT